MPRYIIDEPAETDKFKSHSSIVSGIIRSVTSEPRLRTIGLLGRWGTGKSTIISQLERRLNTEHEGEYLVFKYDAWAHQGDPARRSILEELVAVLVGKRLLRKKVWAPTLQEITGEKEITNSKKESRLTWLAKILILFLLPAPILLSILDFDVLKSVFVDANPNPVGRAVLATIIVYFVALVAIFPLAFVVTRKWRALAAEGPIWLRVQAALSGGPDILSLILTRNTEDSSSTTIRRPQPTTIEFRRILRRLIQTQKTRRLVFVIDNLDRIDPLEALGIWSVIIGLVADEAHRVEPEREPLVIVPLDQESLSDLVKAQHNGAFDSEQLIEKSFDVVFEVPPPVLGDWREYFSGQFEALGLANSDNNQFESYWVERNFEAWCRHSNKGRITPRRINRFLNKIVSLTEQQSEYFRPSLVSYYMVNRAAAETNFLDFVTSGVPASETGGDWQLRLAAIHFGVGLDDAAQVILGDELRQAVVANDPAKFAQIASVRGFDGVLERYIEDPPRLASDRIDAQAVLALCALLVAEGGASLRGVIWGRLCSALQTSDFENLQPARVPEALDGVLPHLSPGELDKAAPTLFAILTAAIEKSSNRDEISSLVNTGSTVLKALRASGFEVKVPVAKQGLARKVLRFADEDSIFAAAMRCDSKLDDVAEHILDELTGIVPSIAPHDAVLVSREAYKDVFQGDFESFYVALAEGAREVLANEEASNATLVAAIEIFALRLKAEEPFLAAAQQLAADGSLARLTQKALDDVDVDLVAATTSLRISYGFEFDDAGDIKRTVDVLQKPEHAKRALASIRSMNDSSFLTAFKAIEQTNIFEILGPLLTEAVRRNYIGHLVPVEWAVMRFSKIRSSLTVGDARAFAKLVAAIDGFEEAALTVGEKVFADYITFLDRSVATALVVKRLASYQSAEWVKLLRDMTPLWSWVSSAKKPLLPLQAKNSELAQAIQTLLAQGSSKVGQLVLARLAKMLAWLDDSSSTHVVRAAWRSAIDTKDHDLVVLLGKNDTFRAGGAQKSVAREAISSLFDPLSRSGPGRTFIERNVDALKGVEGQGLARIRSRLERAKKSREGSVREWADFVDGKLSRRKGD